MSVKATKHRGIEYCGSTNYSKTVMSIHLLMLMGEHWHTKTSKEHSDHLMNFLKKQTRFQERKKKESWTYCATLSVLGHRALSYVIFYRGQSAQSSKATFFQTRSSCMRVQGCIRETMGIGGSQTEEDDLSNPIEKQQHETWTFLGWKFKGAQRSCTTYEK